MLLADWHIVCQEAHIYIRVEILEHVELLSDSITAIQFYGNKES